MRPVVVKQNGQMLFADHVRRGYQHLLSFDKARRSSFYLIGVNGLLNRKFGSSVGGVICRALENAKLLESVGFVNGARGKKWRITRVDNIGSLGYGATKYRSHTKKRGYTRRPSKPCPKGLSSSDVVNPPMKKCHGLSNEIIIALLKNSGRSPKRLPKHVHVGFEF